MVFPEASTYILGDNGFWKPVHWGLIGHHHPSLTTPITHHPSLTTTTHYSPLLLTTTRHPLLLTTHHHSPLLISPLLIAIYISATHHIYYPRHIIYYPRHKVIKYLYINTVFHILAIFLYKYTKIFITYITNYLHNTFS